VEHAPLRPVPELPSRPVPDAAAVALVGAAVPGLDERDRIAFALVALAGLTRPQAIMRLGTDADELGQSLARARKALRRTVAPLTGSGWCERSERLISDRLDGVLAGRDAPRLDAHLRNCPRCVDHERRLVQAADALVAGVSPAAAAPAPAPPPAPEPVAPVVAPVPKPVAIAPVARRGSRELVAATGWNVLLAVAVLLALASLALGLAAALGAHP
jgi:hypothetical protein